MPERFQIVGIDKPGGSDNRSTHITHVLIELPLRRLGASGGLTNLFKPLIQGQPNFPVAPRTEWRTVEDVIRGLDAGQEYYYTDTKGAHAEVIPVPSKMEMTLRAFSMSRPGAVRGLLPRRYIKTKTDDTKVDNLLSLPNYNGRRS